MRFPRATFPRVTLILLLCPAAVVLCASFVGVQASPCLPSASAVRREYQGAWPSWTLRVRGHEGDKCWYPATRTTAHNHRYEMALNKDSVETRKVQSTLERNIRKRNLSISFAEASGLDWPLTSSARLIDTTPIQEKSSFADRFAAVVRQNARRPSSVMQMMIDPIGSSMGVPGAEVESSASPPGLPGNGLEMLVKTAVQRGFWRERQGLVAKKWERVTTLTKK
jgi:hypothetical protein